MNFKALLPIAAALGGVYLAHKYGPAWAKGAAYGVLGYMVANNTPIVQDGIQQRVLPAVAQATA